MNLSILSRMAGAMVLTGAVTLSMSTQVVYAAAAGAHAPIEGSWRVVRHGVACDTGDIVSTFPGLMSFGRGGSLNGYAVRPGGSPALGSPEYGVWKNEPSMGKYSFRLVSMNYEEGGAYAGTTEVAAQLALNGDNSGFNYSSTISIYDANGNLMFSHCGKAEGTRF